LARQGGAFVGHIPRFSPSPYPASVPSDRSRERGRSTLRGTLFFQKRLKQNDPPRAQDHDPLSRGSFETSQLVNPIFFPKRRRGAPGIKLVWVLVAWFAQSRASLLFLSPAFRKVMLSRCLCPFLTPHPLRPTISDTFLALILVMASLLPGATKSLLLRAAILDSIWSLFCRLLLLGLPDLCDTFGATPPPGGESPSILKRTLPLVIFTTPLYPRQKIPVGSTSTSTALFGGFPLGPLGRKRPPKRGFKPSFPPLG